MSTVGHFPAQPHCFTYGGFDMQMNRVIDLMSADGVKSIRVNPWDQKSRFTIAHFWGGEDSHAIALRFCRERGIRTVFSVLLPNPPSSHAWRLRARGWLRRMVKGSVLFACADLVTVINDEQAWVAEKVLGIPRERICVVPTVVDQIFFDVPLTPSDGNGPILCVGTIGARKNQLNLLRAAVNLPNDVILCGRFDDSEPEYRAAIEREMSSRPRCVHRLQDLSAIELRDLYQQCSVLACVSLHETEPASILESMICGRPVVVSDRPFGRNSRFTGTHLCDPTNVVSIQSALVKACSSPAPMFARFDPSVHRSDSVVNAYRQVYAKIGQCK
ncbi:MAG: glycosyltransferase family 4 protein [Gallionellaceae bacterium]